MLAATQGIRIVEVVGKPFRNKQQMSISLEGVHFHPEVGGREFHG